MFSNERKVFLQSIFGQSCKTILLAGVFHLNNTLSRNHLCSFLCLLLHMYTFLSSVPVCVCVCVCESSPSHYPSYHLYSSRSVRWYCRCVASYKILLAHRLCSSWVYKNGRATSCILRNIVINGRPCHRLCWPIFSHSTRPPSRSINVRIEIACISVLCTMDITWRKRVKVPYA